MGAPPLRTSVSDRLCCAHCGGAVTATEAAERGYLCTTCNAELAHLDLAPNGTVRAVLGWLRTPGEVLQGRYRIRGLLGKGGFAATYLVEDQLLSGKRRAIKEVPEIFFDERETEILSRLHHPCIPDITDRFTANGMVYLALEFGGDRTLEGARLAEGGRIPLARLYPWFEQLCDALSYLHAQSPPIVHRDLKPTNLLLDEADRLMVIDFGIAKEAAPEAATRTIARSASHGFSPPEQVLGTGTDQRSDVYALGATMYALLVGEIPPPAHERVAGADVRPPRELVPEIPPAVEAAILRALELNVARRFEGIEGFRRAVAEGMAKRSPPAATSAAPRTIAIGDLDFRSMARGAVEERASISAPVRRSRRRAHLLAAGLAAIALVAAAALWGTLSGAPDPEVPAVASEPPVGDPVNPLPTSGELEPDPQGAAPAATDAPSSTAASEALKGRTPSTTTPLSANSPETPPIVPKDPTRTSHTRLD